MTVVLPQSPDGFAAPPWGAFVRVDVGFQIRTTEDGDYRIIAETPEDLTGPVNDTSEDPPANNYLVCDRSGIRVTVDEGLKKEHTGLMVRKEDWERRHPQELLRVRPETSKGSPRPEQEDRFIEDEYPDGVTLDDLG